MKILVVEDDEACARAYERRLVEEGHWVVVATNAHMAIDNLRRGQFDLVLLDWELQGAMTGGVVKRRIPRGTHIFLVSGHDPKDILARVFKDPLRGVELAFGKPVDLDDLCRSIAKLGGAKGPST